MELINQIIGVLAVLLTVFAYYQHERRKFLIINFFAVVFFGLSLFFKGGYIGGVTSFFTATIYLSAFYLNSNIQKKLQYLIPIVAFMTYFMVSDNPADVVPSLFPFLFIVSLAIPIGSAIIAYSAYQENMIKNKIFLLIGLFFWLFYSIAIQSYWAATADFIGIVVLFIKLFKMIKTDS